MQRTVITVSPKTTADVVLEGNGFAKSPNGHTVTFGSANSEDSETLKKIELQKNRIDSLRKENAELQKLLDERLGTIQQLQKENNGTNEVKAKNEHLKQKLQKTIEELNQVRAQSQDLRKKIQKLQQTPKSTQQQHQKVLNQLQVPSLWAELASNRQFIAKTQSCLLNELEQYRKALQQSYSKQNEALSFQLATLRANDPSQKSHTIRSSGTIKQPYQCQNCRHLLSEIEILRQRQTELLKEINQMKSQYNTEQVFYQRKIKSLSSQINTMKLQFEEKISQTTKLYNDQKKQRIRQQIILETNNRELSKSTQIQIDAVRFQLQKQFEDRQRQLMKKMLYEIQNTRNQNKVLRETKWSDNYNTCELNSFYSSKRNQLSDIRREETHRLGQMLQDIKFKTINNFKQSSFYSNTFYS